MWQAVPCKFWVQRLVFGDVAWINIYHLKRRWSPCRQMSELSPVGDGCWTLCQAHGGDLKSLRYGQRPVQFSWRPTWFKRSYSPLLAYFCNRLNKTHNYNVDNSMCWGWVVQLCTRCEEVIWSTWCVGNDLCKFCSVQRDTSEVTVQYRIFLCRLMDDNHVEQRRQWFNMLFYEVFEKGWDQF